jgi:hypothetical protein
MRRVILAALLATPIACILGQTANAQGRQDFSLVNRTGYQINEVYVGASNSKSWGRDLLGDGVLPNGNRLDITFSQGAAECQWDIRVVYDDGDEAEFMQVNLCRISTVTLFWNRQGNTTRAVTE